MSGIDPTLLVAHVEYASWALNRTFDSLDHLPAEAISRDPGNGCRSIAETLNHLFQTDWYYFAHLKGGTVQEDMVDGRVVIRDCEVPQDYAGLKQQFLELRAAIAEWARENAASRKDDVLHGWGTWPAWQILMHMSNHTTHHLGQISTLIRQAGYSPSQSEWTDLIIYYLQRFPTAAAADA